MSIYDQRMQKYEGGDLLTVVEPKLKSEEKRLMSVRILLQLLRRKEDNMDSPESHAFAS
jgi:hypothetical protein